MSKLATKAPKSLIGMDISELESYIQGHGLEKFRAKQLFKWIYTKSERDFAKMSDLSKHTRELFTNPGTDLLPVGSLKLVTEEKSVDGTIKYLFETSEGDKIESVLMKMIKQEDCPDSDESYDPKTSYSACISSQVGCAVGCPFCATGTLGFKKNLSASEIIEQILFMQNLSGHRISNVVYMGQGEPLANYDNVVKSLDHLRNLVGIGARRITISTSGLIPQIDKLSHEGYQITLALSLHDPTDAGRDFLVPVNKKWPVFEVIDAMKQYHDTTRRRVTIEYILIDGVNDSVEKAKELGLLIKDLYCNINLIPYNATDVNDPFQRSKKENIKRFTDTLMKYCKGKTITVRRERGHDINAACGQLANKKA